MTHRQCIEGLLSDLPGLCDDCLAQQLRIKARQTVRKICTDSWAIEATKGVCASCGRSKITRRLATAPAFKKSSQLTKTKTAVLVHRYVRESDLRSKFNRSIIKTLRLPDEDYYGRLGFGELLELKTGYARIHDIVTLKLTTALVERVGERLNLTRAASEKICGGINAIHPNSSGFDLDCGDPNVIGEVKGCIPMNAGSKFGPAQTKGLTNDVLQMLGRPPTGKHEGQLSKRPKIRRERRADALKFLGLYDSPHVREATARWKESLLQSRNWEPLKKFSIQELSEFKVLNPNCVYLVFLTPRCASGSEVTNVELTT